MTNLVSKLCQWYSNNCIDEWHEEFGISIETLDNPGWSLKIDLKRTNLDGSNLDDLKIERSEVDWVLYRVRDNVFQSYGGVLNLDEMIEFFIHWSRKD